MESTAEKISIAIELGPQNWLDFVWLNKITSLLLLFSTSVTESRY